MMDVKSWDISFLVSMGIGTWRPGIRFLIPSLDWWAVKFSRNSRNSFLVIKKNFKCLCVSPYQKGKTNLDFTEARDSEWQWRQLGHMQVCTLLQTDNHTSTLPLCFLQAGCPSCRSTNSVKALKALKTQYP